MDIGNYSSKLLENAVNEFSKLPGIGKKTALRLVLHLLRQEEEDVEIFGNTIIKLRKEIKHCTICHNISETDICSICSDTYRDHRTICIVENIKDIMAIEATRQYNGVYHVLGGIISPMDGIGPSDLNINSLLEKVKQDKVDEIIFALSTTMEGDTTNFYIYRKLNNLPVKISIIARGVSIGDELEYADEITLGRSIVNRSEFSDVFSK